MAVSPAAPISAVAATVIHITRYPAVSMSAPVISGDKNTPT